MRDTWTFVTDELKKGFARSWRRQGEALLGVARGALRAFVDREHDDAEAEEIEAALADMHSERIALRRELLDDALADAAAFEEKRKLRAHRRYVANAERDPELNFLFDEVARLSGLPCWPRDDKRRAA